MSWIKVISFEEATGMVNDTETAPPVDQPDMELENPESWLDNLATDVASRGDEMPEGILDSVDDELAPIIPR